MRSSCSRLKPVSRTAAALTSRSCSLSGSNRNRASAASSMTARPSAALSCGERGGGEGRGRGDVSGSEGAWARRGVCGGGARGAPRASSWRGLGCCIAQLFTLFCTRCMLTTPPPLHHPLRQQPDDPPPHHQCLL